jgi:hypothetical protein
MHEIAPQLTEAVANRITSTDLHDKALQDLGAFVHRTVVEDDHAYAVRIDDGAMLDAAAQIAHAREHLDTEGRQHQIANILGCTLERLDAELDTLAARARARALKIRITGDVRDRARNCRYAYVHDRGQDFAAGIWVVDPAFMLDFVHERMDEGDTTPAREEAYFAGARVDDELRDAAAEDEQRRARARARHADATRSNLGLGHDIRAGLIQPTEAQLHALHELVCRLLVRHYRELVAYGAGWTDCGEAAGNARYARSDQCVSRLGQVGAAEGPAGSVGARALELGGGWSRERLVLTLRLVKGVNHHKEDAG